MHHLGLLHRDIKMDNVLLMVRSTNISLSDIKKMVLEKYMYPIDDDTTAFDEELYMRPLETLYPYKCFLSDFGCAVDAKEASTIVGTTQTMAPELFLH